MGNNFGILVGQLIGLPWLLGTVESWHILFGLGAVPPIIQLILLKWCPESPEYLHKNGDSDAAQESSFQLHGIEKNYEKAAVTVIKSVTCLDAFKSHGFKRGVMIVVILQIIGQATGTNAIFLYGRFGKNHVFQKKTLLSHFYSIFTIFYQRFYSNPLFTPQKFWTLSASTHNTRQLAPLCSPSVVSSSPQLPATFSTSTDESLPPSGACSR